MAVGKGSMARASKAAATKTSTGKAEVAVEIKEQPVESVTEAKEVVEAQTKSNAKKESVKKATTKKTTTKKAETKPKKEEKVEASAVVEATSEQVMKQIVYQKSSQVLDREAKTNETFGVGEAMPIYFF